MAEALVRATDVRGEVVRWLLADRLPDWDLGIVVSELHSASEALWHGIDPAHLCMICLLRARQARV